MNKLLKLLYVNIIDMFDINKYRLAKENNIKTNFEGRAIIIALIAIFYIYFIYKIAFSIKLSNNYLLLSLGFIISTIICFIINLFSVESAIFKNEDNDILFSLPLSRQQILLSKLFTVYLKNIFYVALVMFPILLAVYNKTDIINDTIVLMCIVTTFIIPLVPIIISTIISFINSFFKIKSNNNLLYKISKILIIVVFIFLIYLLFRGIDTSSIEVTLNSFIKHFNYLYPLNFFFYKAIANENILFFLLLVIISIMTLYIYNLFISNNYLKMCSLLKGVKKKKKFIYHKKHNLHRVFGLVRKEFLNLITNKTYLYNSFGITFAFTIIIFLILNFINLDRITSYNSFNDYFNLYAPTILAMLVTLKNSAICSMSLEKNNMEMLRTMPISMGKIILAKWLTNTLISSIFIVINTLIINYYFDVSKVTLIFIILFPLIAVMFTSLTSIVFDYRFISKKESDDNIIIKQRLINFIPSFISLVIGVCPLLLPIYSKYYLLLGAYILIMVLIIIFEIGYLYFNRKKLIHNLFN